LAADSLWGDEIFSAIFAAKSPAEVIAFTASDIHPPLYYLLVGVMSRIPLWPQGTPSAASDWLWRWPSALAGVLTVAVTCRLGQTLFGRQVGLMAALLLAVAPVAIKYGQEARMHALFMFLSALSTLFLALALRRQGDTEKVRGKVTPFPPLLVWLRNRFASLSSTFWIAYTLVTIANLYTMYFAFIIIAAQGAWVLAESYQRSAVSGQQDSSFVTFRGHSSFVTWSATILIAILAYLPWWPTLIKLLAFRAKVGAVEGGVGNPLAFLPKVVLAIGPVLNLSNGLFGGVAWLFFALYLIGLGVAWRRDRPFAIFGAAWLAIPALLPILLGDSRALHLRYAFVLPVYLIFVSLGLEGIAALLYRQMTNDKRQGTKTLFTIHYSLFTVFLFLSLFGVWIVYNQPKPDWRGAANFVAEQAGPEDVILAGPLWDDTRFFSYYYPCPDRVMPPPSLAFRLPGIAAEMAATGGKVWLVSRHQPKADEDYLRRQFYGVWVMEPLQGEYDPVQLVNIGAEFCKRAARQAEDWAAAMEADGVLNPDPRSSKATAYLCQGDTYAVVGDYERALKPYQKMVKAFPGWADGYATLAKTCLAVDNVPSAVEAFQLAVQYNPNWQGVSADHAAQLATEGRLDDAAALYRKIVD
ncbi:MAG TPA: hypothetical protein G4N96_13170, partial [Chloroflexi bacterium]|nr:hypothetical protein [Chloroflexota bacterium]